MLNFWASWCEPCQREMPALVEFADATGVPVVGLAVTDEPSASRDFARVRRGLRPRRRPARDTAATFGVTGLPATVFLDEEAGSRRRRSAS